MAWIFSGPGCVGHHMKSYMKYILSKFAFIMYCNAKMIFFSDEIHAQMPRKLSKQNQNLGELIYMLLITHTGM